MPFPRLRAAPFVLAFVLSVFGCAAAQLPNVTWAAEADVRPVYRQGEDAVVTISLRVHDPLEELGHAVAFLNVVEDSAERGWPQMAHVLFSSASESRQIFRVPFDGPAWREGVETMLTLRFRPNARPGNYVLVVRLFDGLDTNPFSVSNSVLLAHSDFRFRVEPR